MQRTTLAIMAVVMFLTVGLSSAQAQSDDMGPGEPPTVVWESDGEGGQSDLPADLKPAGQASTASEDTPEDMPGESMPSESGAAASQPATGQSTNSAQSAPSATGSNEYFTENDILQEVEGFFGTISQGLGKVVQKVFKDNGQPNAIIKGSEAGGAFIAGVKYGEGTLKRKTADGEALRDVYWQGPSIGFDIGGNAAKVFMLVYDLPSEEAVFRRYPGVEGSAYFVGGVGVTYLRSAGIVLAPIRTGVGWRLGANIGYLHVTPEASANPF